MADMGAFREAVTAWAATGSEDRGDRARDLAARLPVRSAVLLEGLSDAAAVDVLAARRGRDLAGEGVCVLPMGGATNVGRFARLLGPAGLGLRLTGLCDAGERRYYDRALEHAGQAGGGVFVCAADLEDELIRALGVPRVCALVRAQGEERPCRPSCTSPPSRAAPPRSSCGASWARSRAARSTTAGSWSRPWTRTARPPRSTSSSPTSDGGPVRAEPGS